MKKILFCFLGLMVFSTPAPAGDTMPVSRVILSTSGMAHFEHRAAIDGNATLRLPVRLDQVDDLLKSLVVFDATGHISNVTLPGREPLVEAFRDLPFNYQDLQSPVTLLNALQGAEVTVAGAVSATGKLVRVSPVMVELESGRKIITHHRVSLLTADGLKQGVLEDLTSVKFTDTKLQEQVEEALAAVRANSAKDQRTLDIHLKGKGRRDVNLAYVVEAPLWKSAYRIVLPKKGKGDKGFVQGWAVIENMTGTDWNDVALTLVSGNPVTYHQALYPSYRVTRPELPVEVLGRVMPRVDTGTLGRSGLEEDAPAEMDRLRESKALMQKAERRAIGNMADIAASPAPMVAMEESVGGGMASGVMATMASAAQSAEATTQVLFTFPDKFDLSAGHSMMLPFVSRDLPMERLSVYQPETHAMHPLAAVEFKNDGDSGLPPGIITLYEAEGTSGGTTYVGDAQMPVLGKGEKRLVSYALDSKTQIDREFKNNTLENQVTISKGVLRRKLRYRQQTDYKIKAPAEESRVVLIEHAKLNGYELEQPDPRQENVEETTTHYRIRVPVKAGETVKLAVALGMDSWQSVQISDLSLTDLKAYATSRGKLDDRTRKLFEEMARLRADVDAVDAELRRLEQMRQEIFNDQNRIRENIRSLSGNSDLKDRYMTRLNEQESQLEDITERRVKLEEEKARRLEKLKKFIFGISL